MQSYIAPSEKILFISDAHLGAFSKQKNEQVEADLIALIHYAQAHRFRIAVLGDLFDYWLEYPDYVPSLGQKMLQAFKDFNQQQKAALYITGNHDNWTLGYFTELGFDVEPNARLLHIKDHTILLAHGDATGNNIQNLQRPLFHRLLRNDTFIQAYRALLPPKAGLGLMRAFSRCSSFFGKINPDKLDEWAKKILEQTQADVVICGHDHTPRTMTYSSGTYINLGTFHHHKTLAMYNNKGFELVKWSSNKGELSPFHSH